MPKVYLAEHDTSPPENQVIKSDPTGHLLRILTSRKAREDVKKRPQKSGGDRSKRPADTTEVSRDAKRIAGNGEDSGPSDAAAVRNIDPPQPSQASYTRTDLHLKTLKDLQSILRSWRLPVSGRKEELIGRILRSQENAGRARRSGRHSRS